MKVQLDDHCSHQGQSHGQVGRREQSKTSREVRPGALGEYLSKKRTEDRIPEVKGPSG